MYLVADPSQANDDFFSSVEAALRGEVTMVQLRAKSLTDKDVFRHAIKMKELCTQYGVPFLIDDRVDIALAVGADGVHLGVDDLPTDVARKLGGVDFIIGYSPDTTEQVVSAKSAGVTYLGIGPVYGTKSKADAGSALGLSELRNRIHIGRLPTVGIGGITANNAADVFEAGADGIAVISAILGADDPEAAARQLSRNS